MKVLLLALVRYASVFSSGLLLGHLVTQHYADEARTEAILHTIAYAPEAPASLSASPAPERELTVDELIAEDERLQAPFRHDDGRNPQRQAHIQQWIGEGILEKVEPAEIASIEVHVGQNWCLQDPDDQHLILDEILHFYLSQYPDRKFLAIKKQYASRGFYNVTRFMETVRACP